MLMVSRGSLTTLFVPCLGEQFLSLDDVVLLGDMGVHPCADGSRVRTIRAIIITFKIPGEGPTVTVIQY